MICNCCGKPNKSDARFCGNCGASLRNTDSTRNHRAGSSFGLENPFDISARDRLTTDQKHMHHALRHQRKHRVDTKLHWHPAKVLVVLLLGTLAVVGGLEWLRPKDNPQSSQMIEQKSDDPVLEAKVTDVASKFVCSCGTCGGRSLDTCPCDTATKERQMIRAYLQAGKSPDQVIAAVDQNFGSMKPEFAATYRGRTNSPSAKIATVAERPEILSHFRCPCGKCGMDDLVTCSCDHPHGAKEVKAFVDNEIARGTVTSDQLVTLIDQKYGGRKW